MVSHIPHFLPPAPPRPGRRGLQPRTPPTPTPAHHRPHFPTTPPYPIFRCQSHAIRGLSGLPGGPEVDWYSWGMTLLYLLFGDAFNPAVTSKPGALLKIPAEEICMASRRKFVWWTAGRRRKCVCWGLTRPR